VQSSNATCRLSEHSIRRVCSHDQGADPGGFLQTPNAQDDTKRTHSCSLVQFKPTERLLPRAEMYFLRIPEAWSYLSPTTTLPIEGLAQTPPWNTTKKFQSRASNVRALLISTNHEKSSRLPVLCWGHKGKNNSLKLSPVDRTSLTRTTLRFAKAERHRDLQISAQPCKPLQNLVDTGRLRQHFSEM
jgi:hypothetical protein